MPPYGRYGRRTRMVAVKSSSARKYKPTRKKYSKAPKITFTQKVQKIIASNNENKFTDTIVYNDAVARIDSSSGTDVFTFFNWSAGADVTGSKLFNLSTGSQQSQRIGNTIKLKRWVIKGIIEPVISDTRQMTYSNVGYVEIFFGKLLKNTSAPSSSLTALFQNGNATTTPACKSSDMLNTLNKDKYKVYYRRRFKMGYASDYNTYQTSTGSNEHPANNDFKLSQTFGFDVCKYILKNKHLKYNDFINSLTLEPPNEADIANLTIWATWTPIQGQCAGNGSLSKSLYNINCLTYAEYEDA